MAVDFDGAMKKISEKISPLVTLNERFIGYIDFLGFGKIVEINPKDKLEWIYSNLYNLALVNISRKSMKRIVYRDITVGIPDLSEVLVNMLFVSDSIILWSNDISVDSFHRIILVLWKFLTHGFQYGFPVRGALVKGLIGINQLREDTELFVNGQLVYGPGYSKAVQLEEKQSWSGVIIEKDCLEYYNELVKKGCFWKDAGIEYFIEKKVLMKYNVPCNNTQEEYFVINWTSPLWINEEIIRAAFEEWGKPTDSLRVQTIIQNTLEFFKKIKTYNSTGARI